jgi:hypothetical protein
MLTIHNQLISFAKQANRDGESYGCTAVIALQLGATLYVAHAGTDPCGKSVTDGTRGFECSPHSHGRFL